MPWSRVPWGRVGAMQQGNAVGNNEGPFRGCCITQCIPSQQPLAHSPALSTWPHPAPTGLAGCLSSPHSRAAWGTQSGVPWTADSLLSPSFVFGRRCPPAASALRPSHCHPALRQRQLPVQPQLQGDPGRVRRGPTASPGTVPLSLQPWAVALCRWDSSGHGGWVPRAVRAAPQCGVRVPSTRGG